MYETCYELVGPSMQKSSFGYAIKHERRSLGGDYQAEKKLGLRSVEPDVGGPFRTRIRMEKTSRSVYLSMLGNDRMLD